ncbi:HD-GYP domain-containing protein [Saccharothrix sp. ST-888]|uniref:HD-GYP domain-containing protein n=1 Tax=Saccharothrix sp. ST-888 TaxID=1427391 RepID=UPI0018CF20CB|nr:HD-GYP domain-containing protein [Saccharothrix sp. ST-888]
MRSEGNCGHGGEAEIAGEHRDAAPAGGAAPGPRSTRCADRRTVGYLLAVLAAAVGCLLTLALPATGPAGWLGGPVDWSGVALLAFLHCCWDGLAQGLPAPCRRGRSALLRRPGRPGRAGFSAGPAFFPVLFAGVLILPPAAAALVALPAAFARYADQRRTLRRSWNAAQLAVSAYTAGVVFHLTDGPRLLPGSEFPAALLPALASVATFCLVNSALVAGMRRLAGPRTVGRPRPGAALRGPLAVVLPALVHGAGGLMVAILWRGPYGAFAAVLALLPFTISAWVFAQGHRERTAQQTSVQALVQAVEIKDAYTRGHSERVGRAAVLIAGQLGMVEERLRTLHFAGTLHDVGKLGVATELLRRNGPLSEAERRAVEVHPVFGHELVRDIAFLGEEGRAGILHHHERLDGLGYPDGLAGDRIPEFARIISVADAFDSMTSTRSYRRGRPVAEAVAELERCAGSQFDPAMVRALVAAVAEHGWEPVLPPPGGWAGEVPDIPLGVPEPARTLASQGRAARTVRAGGARRGGGAR